jgi:hypothetical protein
MATGDLTLKESVIEHSHSPSTNTPVTPFGRSSFQITRPEVGTYYFGITAVNNDGIESAITGTVNTHGR